MDFYPARANLPIHATIQFLDLLGTWCLPPVTVIDGKKWAVYEYCLQIKGARRRGLRFIPNNHESNRF
jgi:hypothetical protein